MAEATSTRRPSVAASAPADVTAAQATGEILGSVRSRLASQEVVGGSVRLFQPPVEPNRPRDLVAELARGVGMTPVSIAFDGSFRFEDVTPGAWTLRISSDGFEPIEQRVQVAADAITRVDVLATPLWSTALSISLRRPNGLPLIASLEGFDLEIAGALTPVLLEECPVVGASLPRAAGRLTHKTTDMRRDHADVWMQTWFKQPTAGCACVALGDRVLDAAAFVEGQTFVVLTVDPDTLRAQLCACEFHVLSEDAGTPLPDAHVRLNQPDGGSRFLDPDESGRVRAENLLAGEVVIRVKLAGYADAGRRFTLEPGTTKQIEPILMARSGSIGGSVRFPSAEPRNVHVTLVRVLGGETLHVGTLRASPDRAGFEFPNLQAGEYMAGMMSVPTFPEPMHVRSGGVAGWSWVQVTAGGEATIELVLTEAMWPDVRGQMLGPVGRRAYEAGMISDEGTSKR